MLKILLVCPGKFGWNRALAPVEEGPKYEFAAGMRAVLHIGPDRIAKLDGYSHFPEIKESNRTDLHLLGYNPL
jgi:hypothetical protein